MRRIVPEPELFRSRQLRHKQSRELAAIDRILLANPSAAKAVWKDLQGPIVKTGRPGLSADQVLRAAIIKQMTGYSYSDLCFHLADSDSYRHFCGFASAEQAPKKSALAHSIKRAKRRYIEIMNAPNQKRRLAPYKDLLKITRETIRYANQAVVRLRVENGSEAHRLAEELQHYIDLAWCVTLADRAPRFGRRIGSGH